VTDDGGTVPYDDARTEDGACAAAADEDHDHDGFSINDGDCDDCNPQVNPGAYDFPGNAVDEDCSGVADDETASCDDGLATDDADPFAAARAIDLCKTTTHDATGINRIWGVVDARYVFPDGTTASLAGDPGTPPNPKSHGILPSFGTAVSPKLGSSLLALSSGIALAGSHDGSPGGAPMGTQSATPEGFPTPSPACANANAGTEKVARDAIALELVIRAPTNANSLQFQFDFYTYEYSGFICSTFNDFFVALLDSKATTVPANHNIAFDSQLNPVSVNNGFLEVCSPYTYMSGDVKREFNCALGTGELAGTGFEGHAATGWLSTQSNIVPGEEFTVRFAVWDAGDEALDTTVLIDRFQWSRESGATQTSRP
jgi:Putative metal-binding motif